MQEHCTHSQPGAQGSLAGKSELCNRGQCTSDMLGAGGVTVPGSPRPESAAAPPEKE